jgi:hypothetical protein
VPKQKKNGKFTATTTYPCYLPVLGDSAGAGNLPPQKYEFSLLRQANLFFFIISFFDSSFGERILIFVLTILV